MLKIILASLTLLSSSGVMAYTLTVDSVDGKPVHETYSSQEQIGKKHDNSNLYARCKNAELVEIYTAKAAMFENNGSMQGYQDERLKALRMGATIGYPDDGVDQIIDANRVAIASGNKTVSDLAELDVDGFGSSLVLSPLIDGCLKDPAKIIRNY